ncbi:SDR family NAD(P)-dependent oxidoreductase [Niabella aurantiaca]|uniref:SDR family NAD(P)-dependent oxidoreductase n=1 Tax=Niabella aurantiaca TaxID=379900 RepID=UPI00037E8143|nr:SDR family NAD(P)-dependent oxidoreductase [Niabella aurantiaca]
MKKVLITGANKGIGLEIAKQLAQQGFYVFAASRNLRNGLDAINGLENVEAVQLDVTDDESVKDAFAEISQKTDVLDILINNAGINGIEFVGDVPWRRISLSAMRCIV